MITKKDVEMRLNFLKLQHKSQQEHVEQAIANMHAFEGAIAECQHLIDEWDKEEVKEPQS